MHEGNIFYKRDLQGDFTWYLIDYGRVYDFNRDGALPIELQDIIPRSKKKQLFNDLSSMIEYAMKHLRRFLEEYKEEDPLESVEMLTDDIRRTLNLATTTSTKKEDKSASQ